MDELGLDGLIAIGGEDTLGAANRLHAEHGARRARGAEDDRQRPRRHRRHLRLRHRAPGRDRGDRPPAHDRRVAPPGDGGRGDGPPRGLDRALLGDRRRRRRDPDPRAAVRHRGGLPADRPPPRARAHLLDRRRRRGRDRPRRGRWRSPRARRTSSATCASAGIGQRLEREIEQRTGFETRAVVLGHIQRGGHARPRSTGCWRPGSASPRSTPPTTARWGTMPALRGTRIELVPLARRSQSCAPCRPRTTRSPRRSADSRARRASALRRRGAGLARLAAGVRAPGAGIQPAST